MIDWNEVGYPGTSVFDGMTAAANWNTRALANVDAVNKLREWHLDTNLRNMMRAYQEDEAATALALGKSANEDLRTLDRYRKGLYNSDTGYLDALNAMNPLDGTAVRRLTKDGKNIETVRMDGTVIGTTPNRTGKDAENALLFNYGLGLGHAKANWMNREAARQSIELALAQAQNKGAASSEELMLRLMLGMGAGGGRGGLGGRGGRGRGRGGAGDGFEGFDPMDAIRVEQLLSNAAARITGILPNADGKYDLSMATPEQQAQYWRALSGLKQRFQGNVYGLGMDPYLALDVSAAGLQQEWAKAAAKAAEAATAARLPKGAKGPVKDRVQVPVGNAGDYTVLTPQDKFNAIDLPGGGLWVPRTGGVF